MDALTVCQPFADQIARGEKIIENRTWRAPQKLMGRRFAVHAGKSRRLLVPEDLDERPWMVFGAIVATAVLAACLRVEKLPAELRDRDDACGPWCWLLADVRDVLPPIPAVGSQGFWKWAEQGEDTLVKVALDGQ